MHSECLCAYMWEILSCAIRHRLVKVRSSLDESEMSTRITRIMPSYLAMSCTWICPCYSFSMYAADRERFKYAKPTDRPEGKTSAVHGRTAA